MSITRRLAIFHVALACFCVPNAGMAFGSEGHKVIALIAEAHLTPEARKRVNTLLAEDKDNLTEPDFASRATWADRYRDSDRFSTKKRYFATRHWHYVDTHIDDGDLDKACNGHPELSWGTSASKGPATDCIVDKINQFTVELGNRWTSRAEKILALKFIMHFVGDIHQPLHTADNNDRGGNGVLVSIGRRTKPDNLHSYWDTDLVERLGKDSKLVAETLNKQISEAEAAAWKKGSPADWAMESFTVAKGVAYNFKYVARIDYQEGRIPKLGPSYENRALPALREQLSKAGVRLAVVLNEAFK